MPLDGIHPCRYGRQRLRSHGRRRLPLHCAACRNHRPRRNDSGRSNDGWFRIDRASISPVRNCQMDCYRRELPPRRLDRLIDRIDSASGPGSRIPPVSGELDTLATTARGGGVNQRALVKRCTVQGKAHRTITNNRQLRDIHAPGLQLQQHFAPALDGLPNTVFNHQKILLSLRIQTDHHQRTAAWPATPSGHCKCHPPTHDANDSLQGQPGQRRFSNIHWFNTSDNL